MQWNKGLGYRRSRRKNIVLFAVVFHLLCITVVVFAQTVEQIAEKALASTVYLELKDVNDETIGVGSGFFVAEDKIATNFHVIEGAAKGTVKLVDGDIYYNIDGILATDKDNDLALLKVPISGSKPLLLGNSDDVKIGEAVYVTGNPKGLRGTFSNGIISSHRDRNTKKRLQMTAPISPGSSGGPVLNAKGEVIGISYMTIKGGQNLNFAIPSNYLKKLIAESRKVPPFPLLIPKSARIQPFPQRNQSIKEFLAAVVEAHGGIEKLQAVKNIVMEARATANSPMGQMQIEGKSYYLYPDKFRQDVKFSHGEMGYVFDGTSGFAMTPMGVQPLPPDMLNSFKDGVFRETIWLLTNLSQNDIPVQYAGTEEVEGKSAHVLLVTQPSAEVLQLFVSEETHLIVKLAFRETAQGVTTNRETFIDDYRDVDGIKIAHHIVQKVDGELFTESWVTGVTLNAELEESLFQEPN